MALYVYVSGYHMVTISVILHSFGGLHYSICPHSCLKVFLGHCQGAGVLVNSSSLTCWGKNLHVIFVFEKLFAGYNTVGSTVLFSSSTVKGVTLLYSPVPGLSSSLCEVSFFLEFILNF